MKTTTLILFALLTVGCSTWTPTKTVTLHDVDSELARTEGADLRYLSTPAPQCKGARGCRDTTTAAEFHIYQWEPMCDGQFCGTDELRYVDVAREAARIAFAAEQLVAAKTLLRGDDLTAEERTRYEEFVYRTHVTLPGRVAATVAAHEALAGPDILEEETRARAKREAERAGEHLQRARALLNSAGPAPHSMEHAWK